MGAVVLITLSMIVKNEEALLADCLKSVKDFVDHIIIVDTGSTDSTIEIAKQYGAQVFHFDWCDDFSAARNFALKQVKTPWTLTLDADDIVLNPEIIRKTCEIAHKQRIHGLWGQYKQDESSYQRRLQLFRTKQFKWKGFVHESPQPRIKGTHTGYCDLVVKHRKPVERRPEAALKYLQILQDKDPENWFGIAESYRFLTQHPDDEAFVSTYRQNAEELFFRAATAPKANQTTKFISFFYCARLALEIGVYTKDPTKFDYAVKLLQVCHQMEPNRAEPITQTGLVYEALKQPEKALECYHKALALPMCDDVGIVLKDYYRNIPRSRLDVLNAA